MAIAPDVLEANYDQFRRMFIQSRQTLNTAISADENPLNTKDKVIPLYRKAIRDLTAACSISPARCLPSKRADMTVQLQTLTTHLQMARERLEDLSGIAKTPSTTSRPCRAAGGTPRGAEAPSTSTITRKLTKEALCRNVNPTMAQDLYASVIDISGIHMSDILGNEEAKRALEEAIILPTLNPSLFTGLRQPVKGILLFGPPGNGKTMLAKAVAAEAKCTFFNISAATIMSKWVGEGERLMQALFQMARNGQPSIIFIDEIDSMLAARQENENGATRRVKTEFLLQFDGCSSRSEDRILVLGATNRPQELDDGVIRRFPRRIYIDLPDEKARANLIVNIFEKNKTAYKLSDREIQDISRRCVGYSYSDMTALCREAAMGPLRNVNRENIRQISASTVRPVNAQDLKDALTRVLASANPENNAKLATFAKGMMNS